MIYLLDFHSSQSYFDLRVIAEDIKTLVPTEAILPSENVDHSLIQDVSMTIILIKYVTYILILFYLTV